MFILNIGLNLLDLSAKYKIFALFLIAFTATLLIFEPILKIARSKDILDNPDARKIQKTPIPVMGGIAVFFGIIVGLCFYKTIITYTSLFPILGAMMIMLYIGAIDDCIGIKPGIRFIIEILVCLLICYGTKSCINCFQGFLGIEKLDHDVAIPLTVVTFLGIVNSINMIDGVDGLSSGICIFILGCFGLYFFLAHEYSYAALSAVSIGALMPFLLHNVFGDKTKMFIGDSGTMMIATIISAMVIRVMNTKFTPDLFLSMTFSRAGFVLALLSIPIADTLRVMAVRVHHHKSPFEPDRNHFHHILLKLHFSSISIAAIEVCMSITVFGIFLLSWHLGASVNLQVATVIVVAAILNWVLAAVFNYAINNGTTFADCLRRIGDRTHMEKTGIWYKIQCFIDRKG